jgi:hypothetical protein
MGPIALFDKSFLQSLSLTESVFFDHSLPSGDLPFYEYEKLK